MSRSYTPLTLFITLLFLFTATPLPVGAVPVPKNKPIHDLNTLLEKIEQNAQSDTSLSNVIIPPLTPKTKRSPKPRAPENITVQFDGMTPFPAPKPGAKKTYTRYINDRQAGRSETTEHKHRFNRIKPKNSYGTERIYSTRTASRRNRIDLQETNKPSPFKNAALPKAGQKSRNEPVIIFFQENSLKLEIGQKEILSHDVLRRLKRQKSLKITIYGFGKGKKSTLSQDRAHGVLDYLTRNGISENRITVKDMKDKTHIYPKDRVDIQFH